MVRREVRHWRGHHAEIDDIGTRSTNAGGQGGQKVGARQPSVTADRKRVASLLARERTQRLSHRAHDVRRQSAADDAANVVGLEDFAGKGGHWEQWKEAIRT
jgi:hypothetical protein